MKSISYAAQTTAAKLMLSGIKANSEPLGKRGIDSQFISNLESLYNDVLTLDNEQEALKARLKEKTAALEQATDKLQKMMSEAKKLVKIALPKESWREFGITDSK